MFRYLSTLSIFSSTQEKDEQVVFPDMSHVLKCTFSHSPHLLCRLDTNSAVIISDWGCGPQLVASWVGHQGPNGSVSLTQASRLKTSWIWTEHVLGYEYMIDTILLYDRIIYHLYIKYHITIYIYYMYVRIFLSICQDPNMQHSAVKVIRRQCRIQVIRLTRWSRRNWDCERSDSLRSVELRGTPSNSADPLPPTMQT